MAEHHASVSVHAPVHQVYSMFTHFNDFPKFMSFIKEVTYYDDQKSHWVADVVGQHQWDAVNENWIEDRQIGWRSTDGLSNSGLVTFQSAGKDRTQVNVSISYDPPVGILGDVAESLGVGGSFERRLQQDLDHFAQMVEQAPAGALDPMSSDYLFHSDSAAAKGTTTPSQNDSMANDTSMSNTSRGNYDPAQDTGYATDHDVIPTQDQSSLSSGRSTTASSVNTSDDLKPGSSYGSNTSYGSTTGFNSATNTTNERDYARSQNPDAASFNTDRDIIKENNQGFATSSERSTTSDRADVNTTPNYSTSQINQTSTSGSSGFTGVSAGSNEHQSNATSSGSAFPRSRSDSDYGTPVEMGDSTTSAGQRESGGDEADHYRMSGNETKLGSDLGSGNSLGGRSTTFDDRGVSSGQTGISGSGGTSNANIGNGSTRDRGNTTSSDMIMSRDSMPDINQAGQGNTGTTRNANRPTNADSLADRDDPDQKNRTNR